MLWYRGDKREQQLTKKNLFQVLSHFCFFFQISNSWHHLTAHTFVQNSKECSRADCNRKINEFWIICRCVSFKHTIAFTMHFIFWCRGIFVFIFVHCFLRETRERGRVFSNDGRKCASNQKKNANSTNRKISIFELIYLPMNCEMVRFQAIYFGTATFGFVHVSSLRYFCFYFYMINGAECFGR